LKPITTDVNSDTPVAWSSGMVELTRNFADEAVVPPPLYSSSESLLQATELSIIVNSTDCHFNSFTNIDAFHATEHSFH
jgi:hypothetical protein